jgi:hypothetical protein
MVFTLILILTADNALVSWGGQATESMDACAELTQKQTQELADRNLDESLHIDARCLNLTPLPTDTNIFQPAPAATL